MMCDVIAFASQILRLVNLNSEVFGLYVVLIYVLRIEFRDQCKHKNWLIISYEEVEICVRRDRDRAR